MARRRRSTASIGGSGSIADRLGDPAIGGGLASLIGAPGAPNGSGIFDGGALANLQNSLNLNDQLSTYLTLLTSGPGMVAFSYPGR